MFPLVISRSESMLIYKTLNYIKKQTEYVV